MTTLPRESARDVLHQSECSAVNRAMINTDIMAAFTYINNTTIREALVGSFGLVGAKAASRF
jgi:hypothetical protein